MFNLKSVSPGDEVVANGVRGIATNVSEDSVLVKIGTIEQWYKNDAIEIVKLFEEENVVILDTPIVEAVKEDAATIEVKEKTIETGVPGGTLTPKPATKKKTTKKRK
jgi:SepF-like predicted cell division protein (DUF552 family)